ncbi:MAG: hypothetical protein M3347_11350 [Armatimonadota bacterium]|nr:hypothetical protein [Armatimonadota bacterium]
MATEKTPEPIKPAAKLKCSACGNEDLFAQFMEWEVNLGDGNRNHLHLLEAQVDYYRCHLCGETVEAPDETG